MVCKVSFLMFYRTTGFFPTGKSHFVIHFLLKMIGGTFEYAQEHYFKLSVS